MLKFIIIFALIFTIQSNFAQEDSSERPHIIFILADDAGWNDFSFHGSPQIPTPNIDFLALNGITLNSYYTNPLCTPTRGAIMTGKYPIHIRLQHYVIMGGSADGLPLSEKLLPEYLKELGYSTHLVGKWHLGHAKKVYTPTYRGFDSHFGYWLGKQDFYSHFSYEGSGYFGYDFRRNMTVDKSVFGIYDTDLFTDEAVRIIKSQPENNPLFLMINHIAPHSANSYNPIQSPKQNIQKFATFIDDENRRKYAGVMDKLDDSVGQVIEALSLKGFLNNSIIIFASDNGGAPGGFDLNAGSNWPLRGIKNTLWEGGTRVASLIWSANLPNRISDDLFHAIDWLPTLFEAAGGGLEDLREIDGISQWKSLQGKTTGERKDFLYNIDNIYNNSAYRIGPWKIIQGKITTGDLGPGNWDEWYGPTGRDNKRTLNDVIPLILTSRASQSFINSQIEFNDETQLRKMQENAQIHCKNRLNVNEGSKCDPYNSPCLFNLNDDPCETNNLAEIEKEVLKELLERIKAYNETSLEPIPRIVDPEAAPKNWGYVWTNWKDFV